MRIEVRGATAFARGQSGGAGGLQGRGRAHGEAPPTGRSSPHRSPPAHLPEMTVPLSLTPMGVMQRALA